MPAGAGDDCSSPVRPFGAEIFARMSGVEAFLRDPLLLLVGGLGCLRLRSFLEHDQDHHTAHKTGKWH
ncbi:hypothetical protein [Mesorhizobium sp. B1-1-7]|uniref:hypothetical protein n=1 Tax=Mesorhizobium sp. B1-1-7 TaxID=2589977 RepID=UPI00112D5A7F|nr:hypothetical protein [Mesorhizobium sp. B1-1-7]TPN51336.1 hypothetical protein FJ978_13465 [Mesorhizobium sp. B1-1-7]